MQLGNWDGAKCVLACICVCPCPGAHGYTQSSPPPPEPPLYAQHRLFFPHIFYSFILFTPLKKKKKGEKSRGNLIKIMRKKNRSGFKGKRYWGGGIIRGELQSDGEKWGSHLSPTNGGIGSPSPALGWGRAQKCPPPTSPPLFLWGRGAVGGALGGEPKHLRCLECVFHGGEGRFVVLVCSKCG